MAHGLPTLTILTAMAKKPAKKTSAKSKPAKAVKKVAKASKPKVAPSKKAKPAAAKKPVIKARAKTAKPSKPTKKPALPSKKAAAAKVKKIPPSVKKTTPTKTAKKPVSKTQVPAKAPAPKAAAKTNGAAAPAAKVIAPAPAPAPKVEAKKSGKGIKAPFMPPVAPGKPVPLPKVKKNVLEAAPEIVIKQVYNPKKMPPYFKKQMQRLLELRSALYDAMDGMAKETLRSRPEGSDGSVGGMHMGDAGSDAYDRDFALSMLSKEQDALYEINEALGRLERGVYGVCELSGKKINEERLDALPYTRYTREMQEQIERDNMGGKFRRPVVKSVFGLDDAAEEDEEEEGEAPKEAPPQESSLDFMKE